MCDAKPLVTEFKNFIYYFKILYRHTYIFDMNIKLSCSTILKTCVLKCHIPGRIITTGGASDLRRTLVDDTYDKAFNGTKPFSRQAKLCVGNNHATRTAATVLFPPSIQP